MSLTVFTKSQTPAQAWAATRSNSASPIETILIACARRIELNPSCPPLRAATNIRTEFERVCESRVVGCWSDIREPLASLPPPAIPSCSPTEITGGFLWAHFDAQRFGIGPACESLRNFSACWMKAAAFQREGFDDRCSARSTSRA